MDISPGTTVLDLYRILMEERKKKETRARREKGGKRERGPYLSGAQVEHISEAYSGTTYEHNDKGF